MTDQDDRSFLVEQGALMILAREKLRVARVAERAASDELSAAMQPLFERAVEQMATGEESVNMDEQIQCFRESIIRAGFNPADDRWRADFDALAAAKTRATELRGLSHLSLRKHI